MNTQQERKISKKLSLLLRHRPEAFQLTLDKNGWCEVEKLLTAFQQRNIDLDLHGLQQVVANNNKQRFTLNEDLKFIRANQGHSLSVDLQMPKAIPPDFLYHGTAERFIKSIKKTGLEKRNRQHVHLSADVETAHTVGKRHGKPIILKVKAGEMNGLGYDFFLSKNSVWLTDSVDVNFIEFP